MKNSPKFILLLVFCTLCLISLVCIPFLPLEDESEIYDNTFRLHVLANSDKEYDQELKLKVRDAVLLATSDISNVAKNKEEAVKLFGNNLEYIKETAQKTVYENGYSYPVFVELGKEYYPEKTYNDVRFPEGRYTSLRVNIGNAEGKNWWCVLFPPLCVGSAESKEELAEAGFTPNQIRLLTDSETPEYKVKFKVLEWFQSIKREISK